MKKVVRLIESIKDQNGREIAVIQADLSGDGSTPLPLTTGRGMSHVIGYNDDGSAIIDPIIDELIKDKTKEFMAKAIREQKKLCIENGVDPDLVNILNAEKKVTNE